MIAVITGDIVNSRKGTVETWIHDLKEVLNYYGATPKKWEIYRGDSFQLSVATEKAILAAVHIKAAVKQTKVHDVRMAIGIGEEEYSASRITESNGSAYVRSGECFESLKKQTLAIQSGNQVFDEPFNIMLNLSLLTANQWSPVVAKVIKTTLENADKNQKELAQLLGKSQSTVSESLKRGGFDEMMTMNDYYVTQIS